MSESWSNAIVASHIEVNPGLFIMRVVPDGWELPSFEPGQFAVLGLPGSSPRCAVCDDEEEPSNPEKIIKRAYSIASSSIDKEFLEFYVALVPSGKLTPRLIAIQPGDRVWLGEKIKGIFTLDDVPAEKHVAFIGTGTGLAPYMSMLRTHLTCGSATQLAVLHGARHSWDLGYRSELSTLQNICDNFAYIPVVSRPDEEHSPWSGDAGYVGSLWTEGVLAKRWGFKPTPDNTHVFLCGNPSMVEGLVEDLSKEGFVEHTRKQKGQIHVERYW
ncbi:MAG: ferredoxin--NADP+ reductase [Planctomycetota bacterium]|jgi:ferredoxin--NADP+ reductase